MKPTGAKRENGNNGGCIVTMRVRTFQIAGLDTSAVTRQLHQEKFTGKVTENWSQGTIGNVTAEDRCDFP